MVGSFDRHNLFYGVKSCNRSISFVSELVNDVSKRSAVGESTIIYCTTIRDTEQVCEFSLYSFVANPNAEYANIFFSVFIKNRSHRCTSNSCVDYLSNRHPFIFKSM